MDYSKGIIKETEFFTTSELAEKLKMNVQVITRKIQAGEIFAYKIGKDWRIPEFSVFQWLETNANNRKRSPRKQVAASSSAKQAGSPRTQRSNRKYLLEYILAQFDPSQDYSEDEVDRIIERHHDDFRTVRQEFIAEKMMEKIGENYRRRAGYKFSD
jgi:excisionase family DNA binding protein